MSKIVKGAELVAQICGGWWTLMSGAISIPFALLGLLLGGAHAKELFTLLAFVSLWIFAIGTVRKNCKMIEEKAEEKKRQEKTFTELHERNEAAHRDHIVLLKQQVQTLQAQLDDRARRLETEEKLGNFHQQLLNHIRIIRNMGSSEFSNKNADSKEQGILDPDSNSLFETIEIFLRKEIGGASVAIFKNPEPIKETPVDRQNYPPGAMADIADKFYFERLYQQRVIDVLNHHAANLMKIIENKG